jgi:hypothetical protein
MRHSRHIGPTPAIHNEHLWKELDVLLSENAELRRTAAELMLETTILREALTFGSRIERRFEATVARS